MAKQVERFSRQLQIEIKNSGMSRYAICKACCIDKGTMSKFMSGRVGLGLQTIDRLVKFLELELVKRENQKES